MLLTPLLVSLRQSSLWLRLAFPPNPPWPSPMLFPGAPQHKSWCKTHEKWSFTRTKKALLFWNLKSCSNIQSFRRTSNINNDSTEAASPNIKSHSNIFEPLLPVGQKEMAFSFTSSGTSSADTNFTSGRAATSVQGTSFGHRAKWNMAVQIFGVLLKTIQNPSNFWTKLASPVT